MLTQEQRFKFRLALSSHNHDTIDDTDALDADDVCTDDEVTETADTIDNFFDAQGRRLDRRGNRPATPFEQHETLLGTIYVWDDVQSRKGARRGTLYVMDFGTARAAYFSGEA